MKSYQSNKRSFLDKVNKMIKFTKLFESEKMKKMKKVLQLEVLTKRNNKEFYLSDFT